MAHARLNLSHQSFKDCLYHLPCCICLYRPCINLRNPVRSEHAEDRGLYIPDFHDDREDPDQMRRMDDHRTSWWYQLYSVGWVSYPHMCICVLYLIGTFLDVILLLVTSVQIQNHSLGCIVGWKMYSWLFFGSQDTLRLSEDPLGTLHPSGPPP